MIFDYINDRTGFANGDLFNSENEVREYFTVESMRTMFGSDYKITQEELNEMRDLVIANKWHMIKEASKVFSIRVNINDSKEKIEKKIKQIKESIKEYQKPEPIYRDWTTLLEGHTGKRRVFIYKGNFMVKGCKIPYRYEIYIDQYGMTPSFEKDLHTQTFAMAKFIAKDFLYNESWSIPSKYE